MNLKIKTDNFKMKNCNHNSFILLCTLCFILCTSLISFSQEKSAGNFKKNKTITTIGGVQFYMHTVEKGQTLYAIAKLYDLSLNDIVIENPEAIDGIKTGQVLKVPVNKAKKSELNTTATITGAHKDNATNNNLHKVEAGQTLFSIAKQYDTSIEKLKELNPELKDGLKGGQTLKIPPSTAKAESIKTAKISNVVVEKSVHTETAHSSGKAIIKPDITSILAHSDSLHVSAINYSGKLKDEYAIAFFLPFHAEEANAIDIDQITKGDTQLPNKTTIALQFYEGALLAIDSLKKQKLKAKIFVYDIDDRDSLNILNLLKKPELSKMDLMIGPLNGSSFMPVARFAKEHAIPIVSPFTQINKILFDNLYVCKVLPSTTLQVEQMALYVVDSFHSQNIILVNDGNFKEISLYNSFKNTANKAFKQSPLKITDSLREANSLTKIESMLNPSKLNVIVLPSNNQSYVTEFISKLNALHGKNKIMVFGLQSWINFDNLDFDYLNNLSLHVPSNNYIDYQNPKTQNFIKNYVDKFKTDPEIYAYQGFDVAAYFISSLQKNGTGFLKNVVDDKYQGIETHFNFMRYPSNSGFENKFVFILKYQDNKLVKAN